jgi:hypothetical protein
VHRLGHARVIEDVAADDARAGHLPALAGEHRHLVTRGERLLDEALPDPPVAPNTMSFTRASYRRIVRRLW